MNILIFEGMCGKRWLEKKGQFSLRNSLNVLDISLDTRIKRGELDLIFYTSKQVNQDHTSNFWAASWRQIQVKEKRYLTAYFLLYLGTELICSRVKEFRARLSCFDGYYDTVYLY